MRFITPCICISFILFSGCQSIKKPSESTKVLEQGIPSGQSDISSRPVTDTTEEKQQPLSGEGLATIYDFKSALESGMSHFREYQQTLIFYLRPRLTILQRRFLKIFIFHLTVIRLKKSIRMF